jgi:hypothetical protein
MRNTARTTAEPLLCLHVQGLVLLAGNNFMNEWMNNPVRAFVSCARWNSFMFGVITKEISLVLIWGSRVHMVEFVCWMLIFLFQKKMLILFFFLFGFLGYIDWFIYIPKSGNRDPEFQMRVRDTAAIGSCICLCMDYMSRWMRSTSGSESPLRMDESCMNMPRHTKVWCGRSRSKGTASNLAGWCMHA